MYGHLCPLCGAHLDPNERCDCSEKAEHEDAVKHEQFKKYYSLLKTEDDGQLIFAF